MAQTNSNSASPPPVRKRGGLRRGYTTGACATAAAKAAALALLGGAPVESVEIALPIGQKATFALHRCALDGDHAECSVIKDAGDDPDVTHGAEICATVAWADEPGIHLKGGPGVGVITKQGIGLPVGAPAINPVPRQMITSHVREALGERLRTRGVTVSISVPKGEEIAKKTLNARLGIVGGISILGTKGIVIPYSTAAYRASISQGIDVALANGADHVVLTTGGKSEKFAMKILPGLREEAFVQMGDFVGFSLKECVKKRVREVTIAGMIGKLSKQAAGTMQTHAAGSEVDMAMLAEVAASCGAPPKVVEDVRGGNTARHFMEMMLANNLPQALQEVTRRAAQAAWDHIGGAIPVECIMTDFDEGVVLGRVRLEPKGARA